VAALRYQPRAHQARPSSAKRATRTIAPDAEEGSDEFGGRYPAELYTPSARAYRAPEPPEYPFHDRTVRVTQCGRICIGKRKINLSIVFAGQFVGIREVADKIWLVSFLDFDLGYFDEAAARVEPGANPFASKVLTMSPV
jgi:hypothetical protein